MTIATLPSGTLDIYSPKERFLPALQRGCRPIKVAKHNVANAKPSPALKLLPQLSPFCILRLKEKRIHRVYEQEFRDRAVEMVIHSGKSQATKVQHFPRDQKRESVTRPADTNLPALGSRPAVVCVPGTHGRKAAIRDNGRSMARLLKLVCSIPKR